MHTMTKRKFWIRAVIAAVVILIGWVVFVSSKQLERNRRIQEEVSALEIEAAKIRRENETLSEKIGYFSSSDFREQEAKKKLGLKKAEETVAVIKPAPAYGKEEESQDEAASGALGNAEMEDAPNYKKWWKVFF